MNMCVCACVYVCIGVRDGIIMRNGDFLSLPWDSHWNRYQIV